MGRSAMSFWLPERFTRVAEVLGRCSEAVVERFQEDGAHRVPRGEAASKKNGCFRDGSPS
jgi:hypothetical protein